MEQKSSPFSRSFLFAMGLLKKINGICHRINIVSRIFNKLIIYLTEDQYNIL
jgi:hypothetical protein